MTKITRKAYKFRLETTKKQAKKLQNFADCNRVVWNVLLRINLQILEVSQNYKNSNIFTHKLPRYAHYSYGTGKPSKRLNFYDMMNYLRYRIKTSYKYNFLCECFVSTFLATVEYLDRALSDWLGGKRGKPKFKKYRGKDNFRYIDGFVVDKQQQKIKLGKIGWVNFIKHREIYGKVKNITISREGRHWFASLQVEQPKYEEPHPHRDLIGIDMGIARFATFSDGTFIEPLNAFKKLEDKLAAQQRALEKKIKFSANWKKQINKIAKTHREIKNCRGDFLHKLSNEIAKNNEIICIEDLKVSNMSRSAKGDVDNPGKMVKQKSGLNKSILDQGWGMFTRMLEYKAEWHNGELIKVPAHHTSQTCPECGNIDKASRQSQAVFICTQCGLEENADVVGAKNVLARGHKILAGD